ncbi:MarR family winged helix-turn-helix transcriptional regulator [Bombilactobacillus thymidiniphilus]|uniref:MarR family transcriptional regulator n=1 Tax=Bombilactobacillus thymidiniphilus TaxID=2923363 RepID=A0ABY4PD38_9LACO|nr:MarR family transcriptional regulator [Bombilactobacillus thymidiniphilus]UQS83688.1 MarR family transcriptional regulator [Bombilactobacillus thymidiniphilus]
MRRLGIALQRAQNTLSRQADTFARTLDLTGTQIIIIDFLNNQPVDQPIYQKDIEQEFNIRKSTATNILNLMVKKRLIIRQIGTHDKRLKQISLSPQAQQLAVQIDTFFENSEKAIRDKLGDTAKQELTKQLEKLFKETNM